MNGPFPVLNQHKQGCFADISFSMGCHSVVQIFIIMACHLIAQHEFKYFIDSYKGDRPIMSCLLSVSPLKTGVHSPIFHVLGQALCSIQLLKRPVNDAAVYINWCNERNIAKPLVETWQDQFMSKLEQNKGEEYSR